MTNTINRFEKRKADELRKFSFDINVSKHAEGSCMVRFGDTHVLCTASVEEKVPPFLRNSGSGWVTAEYGMLPRSTGSRMDREAAKGKQSGRTQEIQRLIGRSLRAVIDMNKLGERQIKIDCDVIQADGGTRTASICGAYIAMYLACDKLVQNKKINENPIYDQVAAISCGICYGGKAVLDLDYEEDSDALADANFILSGTGGIIEVQATAEEKPITDEQFIAMMNLAKKGIAKIVEAQKAVIAKNLIQQNERIISNG